MWQGKKTFNEVCNCAQCSAVIDVASKFPNIIDPSDIQKLDSEWRELSFTDLGDLPSHDPKTHIDRFWGEIASLTDGCGEAKYQMMLVHQIKSAGF